jgi:hypothetical protein
MRVKCSFTMYAELQKNIRRDPRGSFYAPGGKLFMD